MDIAALVKQQRDYFATGVTKPVAFRLSALVRLEREIKAREAQIHDALKKDLNKSDM